MWDHCVYIHRRNDTGEPFYVGKGLLSAGRPASRLSRNPWWKRIADKYGYTIEIFAHFSDDQAAQDVERSLIAEFGRADLKQGQLVNLTDGGDGHTGLVASGGLRAKRSDNAKKPRSKAWIASIRRARKNGGNGGVVRHGDKLPQSWRDNIAATKLGEDNPMFGRTGSAHPTSRPVVDNQTGEIFPSVTAAARARGFRMQTLHNMLTGFRGNSTSLRFA